MSQSVNYSTNQMRSRQRAQEALRDQLSLVPPRGEGNTRLPFLVTIVLVLVVGVVGLLIFNTNLQRGAFEIQDLQKKATAATEEEQQATAELQRLSDPQHVAAEARKQGMVAPSNPTFLDLATGRILGVPAVASPAGAVDIGRNQKAPVAPPPPAPTLIAAPVGTAPPKPVENSKPKTGAASASSGASAGKTGQ